VDSVVPAGTEVVRLKGQLLHLGIRHFHARALRTLPPLRRPPEAGGGRCAPQEPQPHSGRAQRDACPVDADGADQALLHGGPLRGPRRLVTHGHVQAVAIRNPLRHPFRGRVLEGS
jgi:hypothetical protein